MNLALRLRKAVLAVCLVGLSFVTQGQAITSRSYTSFQGVYSSTLSYAKGDLVTESGVTYVSLIAVNLGYDPASTPAAWSPISSSSSGSSSSVTYGTTAGTAAQGNDPRIVNAVQAPVANSSLVNSQITVNGTACVLGGSCSPSGTGGSAGVTVVTGTLAAAVTACGSTPTTLLVAQGVTLGSTPLTVLANCTLLFQTGGQALPSAGQTLTILGDVQAPNTQKIFAGVGSIVIGGDVQAAWFGAKNDGVQSGGGSGTDNTTALNTALTACGTLGCTLHLLQNTYLVSGALSINHSSVSILGAGTQGVGNATTTIASKSSSADILDVGNGAAGATVQWTRLHDFTLQRTVVPAGTAKGLSLDNVGGYDIDHVSSQDSITDCYFHEAAHYAVGSNRHMNCSWGVGPVAGSSYTGNPALAGFWLDSADGNAENSILFEDTNSAVGSGLTATTTAYKIYGAATNDWNFYNAFSAGTSFGMDVNYSGPASGFGAGDGHCVSCTFDAFGVAGIRVQGVVPGALGAINFDGGYANNLAGAGAGSCAVSVSGSTGISINGMQIANGNGNGVCVSGSTHIHVVNNTLHDIGQTGIAFTGSTSSVDSLNTLQNAAAIGLSFDSASTGNQVLLNDVASAVTPVSDATGSGYNTLPSGSGSACPLSGSIASTTLYAGAGSGATVAADVGLPQTNCNFSYILTAGSGSTAAGIIAQFHFGGSGFSTVPACSGTPVAAVGGAGVPIWFNTNTTDTYMSLGTGATLTSGTSYGWNIQCRTD